jgi:hypothetical protein
MAISPMVKGTEIQTMPDAATEETGVPGVARDAEVQVVAEAESLVIIRGSPRMAPNPRFDHGFYVDLEKTDDGNLHIALTKEGSAEFGTIVEERNKFGIHAALCTLLEDHLCNGWEMVPPEDIGALTTAPILSDDIRRDEDGNVAEVGRVFWYPDYAVRDEIEEIRRDLVLVFQGVE